MSDAAQSDLSHIASRHGISDAAVRNALEALQRGHGRQAQFDHPDLGGMGQWSSGGMLMIGDMFNHGLKAKVAALFEELAPFAHDAATAERGHSIPSRWPAELGSPSSSGSQNSMHYAIFRATRRLAVERDGRITIYDTGDHRISGVSQQQSGTQELTFSGPDGPVPMSDLQVVDGTMPEAAPAAAVEPASTDDDRDVTRKIERLHELLLKGALTQDEYDKTKAKLLDSP